jgi:hypothetical protein
MDVGLDRHACTEGTRETVLSQLEKWAMDPASAVVYWLNGLAGTGKSTIAISLCHILTAKDMLGASFFCSRQLPNCRDSRLIIPTIAYQLARFSSTFAMALVSILRSDPDITGHPAPLQVRSLLIKPWCSVIQSKRLKPVIPVIVIDALDECENIPNVLDALLNAIRHGDLQGLKFFFTSRPEQLVSRHLLQTCSTSHDVTVQFELHRIEKELVEADIRIYLDSVLGGISPSAEKVQLLAQQAGNLFIYAATAAKFVLGVASQARQLERLNSMIDHVQQPSSLATLGIDQLYLTILDHAISKDDCLPVEFTQDKQVLNTIVCAVEPLSIAGIAELLNLDQGNVSACVDALHAVLYTASDGRVFTFHASFPDFMQSCKRSRGYIQKAQQAGETKVMVDMYCDVQMMHTHLVHQCLCVMEEKLCFNICDHPSSFKDDKDVEGLSERVKQKIMKGLQYACRFWGSHLKHCRDREVMNDMWKFLKGKVLFWFEAMNLLQRVTECGKILTEVENWCKVK